MQQLTDILVFAPDYRLQLAVEVRVGRAVTDEWACELRRHYLEIGVMSPSLFFLLVSKEYSYLWLPDAAVEQVGADYKVKTKEAFGRFAREKELEDISKYGAESLVRSWLSNLVFFGVDRETAPEMGWLFESGLYNRIKGGIVKAEYELLEGRA